MYDLPYYKNFDVITKKANSLELQDLDLYDIHKLLTSYYNISGRNLDFDLFTKLEPYIIREMQNFYYKTIALIFHTYVQADLGSNFFLNTLILYLKNNFIKAELEDIVNLLKVADKEVFTSKREGLNLDFNEYFPGLDVKLTQMINKVNEHNIKPILEKMIYLGYCK